MKTIGQYLHSARKEKNLRISDVSELTKIKKEFLVALEKENWEALPEFQSVVGFVKSFAGAVNMDSAQAVALLRRDYPPKKNIIVSPQAELPKEFRWSPRLTFLLGVGVVIIAIAIYLTSQYVAFVKPPKLTVNEPTENAVILTDEVIVSGVTDENITVIVNTQPVLVSEEGNFTATIKITQNTTQIEVTATSRAGKETRVTRTIKPELVN